MTKKIILPILITAIVLLNIFQVYAQKNQNVESRIEIKINRSINEIRKIKINDLLSYFENQNPRLKINSKIKRKEPEKEKRKSKAKKYHFIPITILASGIIFILWLIIRLKKEKKYGINLTNNVFVLLLFLFLTISGILLIYGYKLQSFNLKFWHVIIGLILIFAVIFHIIIHWQTWLVYFKKIFRAKS